MAKQFESHKKPKLTKAQKLEMMQKDVENTFNSELKKNFIKNMVIGFETANNMIIDYIDKGHSIEEVRAFCVKNVEQKEDVEKIIVGKDREQK